MTAARALRAQQKAMPVIGVLSSGSPDPNASFWAAFRRGLECDRKVDLRPVAPILLSAKSPARIARPAIASARGAEPLTGSACRRRHPKWPLRVGLTRSTHDRRTAGIRYSAVNRRFRYGSAGKIQSGVDRRAQNPNGKPSPCGISGACLARQFEDETGNGSGHARDCVRIDGVRPTILWQMK